MKTKDETKEEFFANVQIPAAWLLTGRSSTQNSIGRLYEIEKSVRDGRSHAMKYVAITWNKTSTSLNEFIANNQIFNNLQNGHN
jgi:hypothetical protein